jgi:uncharacterized membrane protein YhaH (DUF805 family)
MDGESINSYITLTGVPSLIALAITFGIVGVPVMRILHRTGFSAAWVLIMFVPVVNVVFLWIYAFTRWPVEEAS